MKYTLVSKDNEALVSSNNFDNLIDMADRDMDGSKVVETAAWREENARREAMNVHMQREGITFIGRNLRRIKTANLQLTNNEFVYLMRHTFLNGEYGCDMDVMQSEINWAQIARIATPDQREFMHEHQLALYAK